MGSCSQILDNCITKGDEALNLVNGQNIAEIVSTLEKMTDKNGNIIFNGIKTTLGKMLEYLGLSDNLEVMKELGRYTDRALRVNYLYTAK